MGLLRLRGKLFLLVLFCATFLWSGGWHLWDDVKRPSINGWLLSQSEQSPVRRVSRIFFLPVEVAAKTPGAQRLTLDEIPLVLQQATIAVEDSRFYRHPGFDVEGILRALLVNLQTGEVLEGGSTITQQLAKNLFLRQEKTFGRKAEELALAISLEVHYSKEEILALYLHSIYYGSGAYGINEASRIYFDKAPSQLSLAEAALLAGLPNAPSLYSPYVDLQAAKNRQAVVLQAMIRNGFIGPQKAAEARTAPLRFAR